MQEASGCSTCPARDEANRSQYGTSKWSCWTCPACSEVSRVHWDACQGCGTAKPQALSFASLEDEFRRMAKRHAAEQDGYPALTQEQIQGSDMSLSRFMWWLPYHFGLRKSLRSYDGRELPMHPTVVVEFTANAAQATHKPGTVLFQRMERELCRRNVDLYSGFYFEDSIFAVQGYAGALDWIRTMQHSWVETKQEKLYQSRVHPFIHDNTILEQSMEENGVWNELKGKVDIIVIKDLLCECPRNGSTCGGISAANAAEFMRALSKLLVDDGRIVVYQGHYSSALEFGTYFSPSVDPTAGAIRQGRDFYFTQVDVAGDTAETVQIWKPKRPSRNSTQDALRSRSQEVEVHEQDDAPRAGRR